MLLSQNPERPDRKMPASKVMLALSGFRDEDGIFNPLARRLSVI
jgi:hypothetical protein